MKEEFSQNYSQAQKWHWWFKGRARVLNYLINKFKTKYRPERVLFLGGGYGFESDPLKNHATLFYCDYDQNSLHRISDSKSKLCCSGSALPFKTKSFDWVCGFDVLEHIKSEPNVLIEIKRILKPEGLVLLTVPAYQWLWSQHDELNEHQRRYTVSSLETKLKKNSFRVVYQTYFNTLLALVIILIRILQKIKKSSASSDFNWSQPGLLNKLLGYFFGLEQYLLRFCQLPFGISLFTAARPAKAQSESDPPRGN